MPQNDRHAAHINPVTYRLDVFALLRTLLHEMCHAFLMQYSCCMGISCGSEKCRRLYQTNGGVAGHGRAWQYLAKAIEDEAPRLLGWNRVCLGRRDMICMTTASSYRDHADVVVGCEILGGGFSPSACDLKELCGDFEVLARVSIRMRIRDDDLAMHYALQKWAGRRRQISSRLRRVKSAGCLR